MKKELRSLQTMSGRTMAGARSLWRANGMKEEHFGRPVIAVVNSFSQFVPGHVHLQQAGRVIREELEQRGLFAAEFNTIAIDDGIAMGQDRKSTRLNSSHVKISYAVFCLKKKKKPEQEQRLVDNAL